MDNNSFRQLVESINDIDEGKPAHLKGSDSLKGKDKPGKKAAAHGKFFGESNNFMPGIGQTIKFYWGKDHWEKGTVVDASDDGYDVKVDSGKIYHLDHGHEMRPLEEDYGFLSEYLPEEEIEEDLVTSMKREMNDYMRDKKTEDASVKKFSKKGTRARKPKPKKIGDDTLIDSEQIDEIISDPEGLDKEMGRQTRKGMKDPFKVENDGFLETLKQMYNSYMNGSKEEKLQDLRELVMKIKDENIKLTTAAAEKMAKNKLGMESVEEGKADGPWVLVQNRKIIKTFKSHPGNKAFTSSDNQELMTAKRAKKMGITEDSKTRRYSGKQEIESQMDDMAATDDIDDPMGGGPYAVVWHGQAHEWYGDDVPSSGVGRYKPKGDAGNILAINIPDYAEAEKVLSRVEHLAQDQGKWGEDDGVVHSDGAEIISMKELGEHFWGYKEGSYYSQPEDHHHQNMIDYSENA